MGVIENLTVNHNLETTEGAFVIQENTILPKLINIDLSFSVMHEEPLGWRETEGGTTGFESSTFPYGVLLDDTVSPANDVAPQTVIIPGPATVEIGERDTTAATDNAIAEVHTVAPLPASVVYVGPTAADFIYGLDLNNVGMPADPLGYLNFAPPAPAWQKSSSTL